MSPKFKIGDTVMVKSDNRMGNPRTPDHIKGKKAIIVAVHGVISNPKDHRRPYPTLYTIVTGVGEVFGTSSNDKLYVDVHEDWLEGQAPQGGKSQA